MSADINDLCEAAACLWEATLELRDIAVERAVADSLKQDLEDNGTSAVRMMIVGWSLECHEAWEASEQVDCFDWDFVPAWLNAKLENHYGLS